MKTEENMTNDLFQKIISELPFPVAFRSRFILAQADKRSALESIIDAYEALLRFLALVAISDYLRGFIENPAIDERLKKLFSARISPGHWVEIFREILKAYSKSSDKIYMPELMEFYLMGKKLSPRGRLFEKWVKRRNDFRGHAKHLTTDILVLNTWNKWWPEFQELIHQMAFLTHYEMIIPVFIQRGIIKKAQICSGPNEFFLFHDEYNIALTVKGVEQGESLILVDKRNQSRQLLLYPFMVVKAPANFYLFQQGERRKDSLSKVIFASLGPGDALEIRRADQDRRIIEDLENRLKRLGEIGLSVENMRAEAFHEKPEDIPLQEAFKVAAAWAKSGYPYHVVEGISDNLKALLRHPPAKIDISEKDVLGFLMVAALHFGGNWHFWVKQNINNPNVYERLLSVLSISYSRPRFRALFALQSLNSKDLKKVLDKRSVELSPDIQELLNKYILHGKFAEYLSMVKEKGEPDIAKRAASVLREIGQYSGKVHGSKGASGLPLL